MGNYKVIDLLSDVITGEWGKEPNGEQDVKVIRTANFTNVGQIDLTKEVVLRNIEKKKVEKKRLQYGDIIIEKSGGSPEQPVGRVVFFDINNNDIYLCNNFTSILRPNSSKIENKYLFYFLFYQHKIRKVLKYQNKTTGIINLKLENYLTNTNIKLPNRKEQQRIVRLLDQSFELIEKRKNQIREMDRLTQSLFMEMFGDPFLNTKNYPKKKLGNLGKVITGNTPSKKNPDYYGDYIEWIKSDNINPSSCFLTTAQEYLSKLGSEKGRLVPENSILVTCIAGSKSSIGKAAIANRKVAFNQQINAIIPNENVNVYFLYTHFQVGKKLVQLASTNGMKGLVSKSAFEKIEFICPPFKEQENYGEMFLLILEKKNILLESLKYLEENYNSIMQRAFKGLLFNKDKVSNL